MTAQPIHPAEPDPGRAPLLLTLRLTEPAQSLFQALRERHFPAARNQVPAHVSLFHALPGEQRREIEGLLLSLEAPRMDIRVGSPVPLGRGVAFPLVSPGLSALHGRLAAAWQPWLTAQDRAPFRPHVTVQNKVSPETARDTLARLAQGFVPWETEGAALRLWRYLGGPWEALRSVELSPACENDPGRTASFGLNAAPRQRSRR